MRNIYDENEIAWALEWVTDLLASEGVEITPDTKGSIWSALDSLASALSNQRTLTGWLCQVNGSYLTLR